MGHGVARGGDTHCSSLLCHCHPLSPCVYGVSDLTPPTRTEHGVSLCPSDADGLDIASPAPRRQHSPRARACRSSLTLVPGFNPSSCLGFRKVLWCCSLCSILSLAKRNWSLHLLQW